MKFANWNIFYFIWAIVPVIVFLSLMNKKKQSLREMFVEKHLLDEIAPNLQKKKEKKRIIFISIVLLFSIFALMRPQWGFKWQEIKGEGLDILVAIDTSKSMLTDDVKPNRLGRSKLAVKDLIKKLHGDRIGLIAFAGGSFLVCPFTVDYHGFLLSLDDISPETIPQGGTSLAAAIKEGIATYKSAQGKYKAMIIITDGEDFEGNVADAAREAQKQGIKIFCIGIGTKDGELIRIRNNQGNYEFLKDKQGNFVKSRLNENILQEVSLLTDGTYVHASGARFGLDLIYDQRLVTMEKHEIKSTMEKRYFDRFQIPLLIALIFLCWETLIGIGVRK
ncbi:MAG: VWA domain-containing protein [Candidatus Zapsychrus exili]|nr:VWA domain-containing protein [Candidatus Zapsychrus exili]